MKYKPPTRIAPVEIYRPAFNKHFKELLELYKASQPCVHPG